MAAGQDYPDVIIMNTSSGGLNDTLYDSMVKNGIILPLDEYLTDDIAPNILEYTHAAAWDAVKDANGSTYVIPRCTIIREDYMTLRSDWLETLGLDTPETIEDWREYFKAVTTQDPDGNGIADTYGVTDTSGLMTSSGAISMRGHGMRIRTGMWEKMESCFTECLRRMAVLKMCLNFTEICIAMDLWTPILFP